MSLHPDADALVRAFLDHPTDETPRLVLADWLDDTGRPEDAAWAAYIRARSAADRLRAGSFRDEHLREASKQAESISAVLTVCASQLIRAPASFIALLPARQLTVRLDGEALPRDTIEFVPQSVARTNRVVPLAVAGSALFIAAADPTDVDMLQRLEFILNRDIVPVRASADEIDRAIEAHYPWVEVESVTEELLIFPEDPWPSGWADSAESLPVVRLVNLILTDAIRFGAGWIEVTPERDAAYVQYRVGDTWISRRALPRRLLPAVVARFAEMAGISAAADGVISGDGEIPLLVGDVRATFAVVVVPLPVGPWVWVEHIADPDPVV